MNEQSNNGKKVLNWKIVAPITITLFAAAIVLCCYVIKSNHENYPDQSTPTIETTETEPDDNRETIDPEDDCTSPWNDRVEIKKPIIYLYPEEEMRVRVELGKPETLTCSYPIYNGGWEVIAKPNGDLIDIATGRNLYSLYYESEVPDGCNVMLTGFVVAKDELVTFLEEKLEILGLNEHEAQEFIIYWLPVLQQNEYTYIRFAIPDEIDRIAPLKITPQPDTIIRVLMYFKGIDEPIEVNEQHLTPVERSGFTVVEWGGSELNDVFVYNNKFKCNRITRPIITGPRIPPFKFRLGNNK